MSSSFCQPLCAATIYSVLLWIICFHTVLSFLCFPVPFALYPALFLHCRSVIDSDIDGMSFDNTGNNAVNGDTAPEHTMAADTENMNPETFLVFWEYCQHCYAHWQISWGVKAKDQWLWHQAQCCWGILRDQGHKDLPSTAKTWLNTDPVESQMVSGVECVKCGATK